jgi:hypothetical protein
MVLEFGNREPGSGKKLILDPGSTGYKGTGSRNTGDSSVADPGSGAFLTPGSLTHILESFVIIFLGKKFYNFLKLAKFFSSTSIK